MNTNKSNGLLISAIGIFGLVACGGGGGGNAPPETPVNFYLMGKEEKVMKRLLPCLVCLLLLFGGLGQTVRLLPLGVSIASAATFDLATDWSDDANPNGVWTYREGTNALPFVPYWPYLASPDEQSAWAPSAEPEKNLPAWFQSNSNNPEGLDFLLGDVVVHSTDESNGALSGVANVIWTSPINGVIDISGAVWMARDINRSNRWTLLLNEVILTSGDIFSGDRFNRSKPFPFAKGSGGPKALKRIAVSIGDVIELRIEKTSDWGDYVGVNLTITEGRGRRCCAGYQNERPNSKKSRNHH
jgi:hypothetical protein